MDNSKNKPSEDLKITGNWSKPSKSLQQKFTQLTDEDVKFEAGKENELVKRVQTRLNKDRKEVVNIIQKELNKTA